MKINKEKKALIGKLAVAFGLGVLTCFLVMTFAGEGFGGEKLELRRNEQINRELINIIDENYYNDVDSNKAYEYMRKGLVLGLNDPYAVYFNEDEYESYMNQVEGEFEGIGITFAVGGDNPGEIVSVIKGGPAYKAGVKPGSIIVSVDNKKFTEIEEPSTTIKGKEGTKVKLVLKVDGKIKEFNIERAKIKTKKVKARSYGDVGYIKILNFDKGCAKAFSKNLKKFEKAGVSGLVIDLRGNGGGLVDEAVTIADSLMGEGVITTIRNKEGANKSYSSDGQKTNLPMVLLVDGNTASASEILASALQDNKVCKVIGTKTFGKGIIQSMFHLSNKDVVKLTVYEYYSPLGKRIHKKGVTPNFIIKDEGEQLDKALELMTNI